MSWVGTYLHCAMLHWVNCHIRRRNVRCRHLSYSLLQPRYRGGTANLSNAYRLLENILLYIRLTNISYFLPYCFVDNRLSSFLLSVVNLQCWLSFWYGQSFLSIPYPSGIGDLNWFWLVILLRPFGFIAPKILNYLAFKSFDFERTRWKPFQKRVACIK